MISDKPVKNIDDLMGKKTFFFPDELANERIGDDNQRCILLRINGKSFYVLTGKNVELTQQEFAVLRDSAIITNSYTYEKHNNFDPLR